MKNYMIFGDSHLANLRNVYRTESSNTRLSFFPAIGPVSRLMQFSGHKLTLKDAPKPWPKHPSVSPKRFQLWYDQQEERFKAISNTKQIDIREFNGVVIYGGNLLPTAKFDWWAFINRYRSYSLGFKAELLKQHIDQSVGFGWLDSLSLATQQGTKISVILNPYLNELGRSGQPDSAQDLSMLRQLSDDAQINELLIIYRTMIQNMGMSFIEVPKGLYGSHGIKAEFKHPTEKDFWHLNSAGSKKILRCLLEHLA